MGDLPLEYKTLGELYAPYEVKPEGQPILIWITDRGETWKLWRPMKVAELNLYKLIERNP